MIIFFIVMLAALGAAVVFRGHETRGLLVLFAACAAPVATFAVEGRWAWMTFSLALCAGCLIGIAVARREQ